PLIRPSCRYAQIRRYAPERPACSFFLFTLRQPPTPTLFPYTTLFRSEALGHRHAAGMASLDLADRLVRSPQRTLLGEDGLALLVTIADKADPADETALALNEEVAAFAAALGRHDVALERRLLFAERVNDAPRRARAFLEAAKSAFALNDPEAAQTF